MVLGRRCLPLAMLRPLVCRFVLRFDFDSAVRPIAPVVVVVVVLDLEQQHHANANANATP